MQINDILKAIENIKLDVPSSEYVEIKAEDLETLYSHIKKQSANIEQLTITMRVLDNKVDCLQALVDVSSIKSKRLDSYA